VETANNIPKNVQQKLGKLQDDRSEVMIETLGSLLKKLSDGEKVWNRKYARRLIFLSTWLG